MGNLSIIVGVILLSLGVSTAQSGGDPKAAGASPQAEDKKTAKDAKVQQAVQPQSTIKSPTTQSKPLTVQKTAAKDPSPAHTPAHTSEGGRPRKLANLIVSNLAPGCIPYRISEKNPDCVVEDVTQNADGTTQVTEIPRCGRGHGSLPCWRLEKKSQCATRSPQGLGMTVDRPDSGPPANSTASVSCAN